MISMVAIRVLQGMCCGVTFPCIHNVWLFWAPIPERSRMASIGVAGMLVGTVIGMPISGFLATSLGWESIFYVFGSICFSLFMHVLSVFLLKISVNYYFKKRFEKVNN